LVFAYYGRLSQKRERQVEANVRIRNFVGWFRLLFTKIITRDGQDHQTLLFVFVEESLQFSDLIIELGLTRYVDNQQHFSRILLQGKRFAVTGNKRKVKDVVCGISSRHERDETEGGTNEFNRGFMR